MGAAVGCNGCTCNRVVECENYDELFYKIENINFRIADDKRKYETEGRYHDNYQFNNIFYEHYILLCDVMCNMINQIRKSHLTFSKELCNIVENFYDEEMLFKNKNKKFDKALSDSENWLKEVHDYGRDHFKHEVIESPSYNNTISIPYGHNSTYYTDSERRPSWALHPLNRQRSSLKDFKDIGKEKKQKERERKIKEDSSKSKNKKKVERMNSDSSGHSNSSKFKSKHSPHNSSGSNNYDNESNKNKDYPKFTKKRTIERKASLNKSSEECIEMPEELKHVHQHKKTKYQTQSTFKVQNEGRHTHSHKIDSINFLDIEFSDEEDKEVEEYKMFRTLSRNLGHDQGDCEVVSGKRNSLGGIYGENVVIVEEDGDGI